MTLTVLVLMLAACAVAAEALDAVLTWLEGRGGTWAQTVAEAKREENKLARSRRDRGIDHE